MNSPEQGEGTLLDRLQAKRDGRNVDPRSGILSGEGAQQRVDGLRSAYPAKAFLPAVPSEAQRAESPSYYGMPVVKEPVWIWSVPTYLYVGGISGAASLMGLAVDVAGRGTLPDLARRCRWVGTVGDMLSAGLLIHDLGRPERFLNMLRVFRPTSPMSVGSWILAASGGLNTVGLLLGRSRGALGLMGKIAGTKAALLGMPLAGYTAVLLCNTAVPLWQGTHKTLPLFFMASATAGAGSLLSLFSHGAREERVLHRYRLAGKVAEVIARGAVEREAGQVKEVVRHLKQGASGTLWKVSKACAVTGLALDLLPRRSRWTQVAADLLTTVGAVTARFAIFHAGKLSTRDPQATFKAQRQGHGAAEVTGHEVASDGKPLSYRLPVIGQGALRSRVHQSSSASEPSAADVPPP